MSRDIGHQLHGLARRQRMRIWLSRVYRRLPALLWWNALVLFPGACIHQLILPLYAPAVLSVAIAPSLLGLMWFTVTDSPTVEEGAAAADRLFHANSLFVSAWELCRSAAGIEGTGVLLLARAESALPGWRLHARQTRRRDMTPASLAAVTLALAGLLFLLSPSHVRTAGISYTSPAMPAEAVTRADDPAAVLGQLFTPAEQPAAPMSEQQDGQQRQPVSMNIAEAETPLPGSPESAQRTREQLAQTRGDASPLRATAAAERPPGSPDPARAEGEKIPDRTPGDETASNAGTPVSAAERFGRTRLFDIDTDADTRSIAFDNEREGAALLASGPRPADLRQPADRAGSQAPRAGATSLLSAAQRTLVWRYFKHLEQTGEPNE